MQKIDWSLLKKSLTCELSDRDRAILDGWLAESPEHARYYDRLRDFLDRDAPQEVDVRRNIEQFMRRTGYARRRWRITGVAAAAAALVALGVFLLAGPREAGCTIVAGNSKAILYTTAGKVSLGGGRGNIPGGDDFQITEQQHQVSYAAGKTSGAKAEKHTLETPHGGEYRIVLSDGTTVWMNCESRLDFPPVFAGGERRVSLSGEAFFDVAPSGVPFIIEAGGTQIRVHGTRFNVRNYADEHRQETTLVEGSVEVTTAGASIQLAPGEQAVLDDAGSLSKQQVDADKHASWKDGNVVFEDERLEDIMHKLGRWYNFDVRYRTDALRDIRFTGNIDRYGDIRTLLEKIAKLNVVRFDIDGNQITVSSK